MQPIFFNLRICVLPNCRTLMNFIKQRQQINIQLTQPYSKSGHHSSSQLTGCIVKPTLLFSRLALAADDRRIPMRSVSTKLDLFCHNATPKMLSCWSSTQTKAARYLFWASMSGLVAMLPSMCTKCRIRVNLFCEFLSMF